MKVLLTPHLARKLYIPLAYTEINVRNMVALSGKLVYFIEELWASSCCHEEKAIRLIAERADLYIRNLSLNDAGLLKAAKVTLDRGAGKRQFPRQ